MIRTIILLCCVLWEVSLYAKPIVMPSDTSDKKKSVNKWVKLSGQAQVTYDFYRAYTAPGANFRARRPPHLVRFVLAPTVTIGKKIVLPFELNMSSVATNVTTPVEQYRGQYDHWYGLLTQFKTLEDFKNYVINPINRLGVAPTFGAFKFYAGTQTPQYSEMTVGNVSLFGAGMDVKTKWFYLSAGAGYAQHAIQRDSLFNIPGAYQRTQYSVRAGIGNKEGTFLGGNVVYAADDAKSIIKPLAIAPQTALTASGEYQIKLGKVIKWKGEVATTIRTSNTAFYDGPNLTDSTKIILRQKFTNPIENKLPQQVRTYLPINPSTLIDFAATSTLNLNIKGVGFDLKGLYVGPGFKPVGYPFFVSDRFDATVGTKFSMFKNKVNFNGTTGWRISNFSKWLEKEKISVPKLEGSGVSIPLVVQGGASSATEQLLVNANLGIQFSEKFNLETSYSNFGVQNTVVDDTLRVRNVGQNFAVTPSYTFGNEAHTSSIILMGSMDLFRDLNIVSGALNDNDSKIANLTYTLALKKNPLTANVSAAYFNIVSSNLQLNSSTFTGGVGYSFFKKKLTTQLALTALFNNQKLQNGASLIEALERQTLMNVKIGFRVKGLNMRFDVGNNAFVRGVLPSDRLKEWIGKVSVQQNF
jgi:hypothetical protein